MGEPTQYYTIALLENLKSGFDYMKNFFIFLIKKYRKNISPNLPPSCRFNPTCSSYGIEAIEKFGAFRGGIAAVYRILRCNPFNKGGVDFVPSKFSEIFFKKTK